MSKEKEIVANHFYQPTLLVKRKLQNELGVDDKTWKKICKLLPKDLDPDDLVINIPVTADRVYSTEREAVDYIPQFLTKSVEGGVIDKDAFTPTGDGKVKLNTDYVATCIQPLGLYREDFTSI